MKPIKKFFFQVLTSFMGAWLAIVLAGVVAVVLIIALFSSMMTDKQSGISDSSVLKITLEGTLVERANAASLNIASLIQGNVENNPTVEVLTAALREAADDARIKCVYLDCKGIGGAPASLHAVRDAVVTFRKSGKKVYAYADTYTGGDYFIASAADEIVLNPAGEVQMQGLGGVSIFYKDFFDKVGIEFQAVRVGKGKAAVEPYTSSVMSEVVRNQSQSLYDTLWLGMRRDMAAPSRGVSAASFDTLISRDMLSCQPASFVLKSKLVTGLEYRHKYEDKIAKQAGQEDGLENVVTPGELVTAVSNPMSDFGADNQVAVLYAVGGIDSGMDDSGINSARLVTDILELADDDNVKALVLRVCSPGGSAFGSEQIWEALETFKKTGKPFVVSMGDYAASGGYYISCGASRIYADPLTITGSIGIFGLIPNINGLCKRLGLNPQMVATNPQALFPTLLYPLDERQYAAMQQMVENGYALFVKRCAEGRHTTVAKIEEIADGRPLAATVAKRFGLVDEIGSLEQAVDYAAKQAKLKNWQRVNYPNAGNAFKNLLKKIDSQQSALQLLDTQNPEQLLRTATRLLDVYSGTGRLQSVMPQAVFTY